jgi:cytoskeletal protein RodZ
MSTKGFSLSANQRIDLPALRQHKGISLRDIAETTKISIRFLKAIEEEDFDQLPGGIYNTNYIRQYAREIGCEETKLLAYYRSVVETAS